MNVKHNGRLRSGRKAYRVHAEHKNTGETVTIRFMAGRGDQDRGDYGKWITRSLNGENRKHEIFDNAAKDFHNRTGQKPPQPNPDVFTEVEDR